MSKPRFVDDSLGYWLGQASHTLFRDFEAVLREAGLSALEWRVLATLSGQPGLPVGQLAREVFSQQPTVTKRLQRLVTQGWVVLHSDPADHRRTLVVITPAGKKKAAGLIERARQHEAHILQGMSAAEIAQLKHQLRRLAQPE